MPTLFRKEAVAHRSDRLQGEIILSQPLSGVMLTMLLLAIVAGAIAFLMLGSYARTETARGILVPSLGAVKVLATRAGTVKSLFVQEGDIVEEGQQLATIEVEQPGAAGGRYTKDGTAALDEQERLAQHRIELAELKAQSDAERLEVTLGALEQQRLGLRRLQALQSDFVRSTKTSFEPLGELVQRGVVSRAEFERRRQAVIAAQQEESKLTQQIEAIESDLARTRADLARARIDALRDVGDIRASIQTLQQQKSRLLSEGGYVLLAPGAGRVTALQGGVGRPTGGAMPLMTIVPVAATVSAEIYAPSRAIGFVRPGQEVRLLYDAFPYQRFGSFEARIRSVSRVVLSAAELDAPIRFDEPVYRVTAELKEQDLQAYGQQVAFRSGMLLMANIILERRSFFDWLLAPFNAVAKRNA